MELDRQGSVMAHYQSKSHLDRQVVGHITTATLPVPQAKGSQPQESRSASRQQQLMSACLQCTRHAQVWQQIATSWQPLGDLQAPSARREANSADWQLSNCTNSHENWHHFEGATGMPASPALASRATGFLRLPFGI